MNNGFLDMMCIKKGNYKREINIFFADFQICYLNRSIDSRWSIRADFDKIIKVYSYWY